jgi:hypothetical protein
MGTGFKGLFQLFALSLGLFAGTQKCFSQDAYMNLADTSTNGLFQNFLGIKFFAGNIGVSTYNQDLQFKYVSNNLGAIYTFQHDMNVKGINNMFNLGLGFEENLGKHLAINFLEGSVGYIQDVWNWNIGTGVGYFVNLNKSQKMRLNLNLNLYYECITYSFGSYYDSTQLGFLVDGVNVGAVVKNVKYVCSIWSLNPGVEFTYRTSGVDFFAGISYSNVFIYNQKINFYSHSIATDYNNQYGILTQSGAPVGNDILNTNKYIIHIGIIREFGI